MSHSLQAVDQTTRNEPQPSGCGPNDPGRAAAFSLRTRFLERRVTSTAPATIANESSANLTATQLLRRPGNGTISRFGACFRTYRLSDRWSAIAYVSGDSQHDSDAWSDLGSAESFWQETLARIQDDLTAPAPAGQLLHKSSAGSQVAQLRINRPTGEPAEIICKQGRVDTVTQRLGSWLKGPKEWREFWLGHRLRQLGLPTPLPLACMWRRAGFCHLEGRIVTAFVANALPIDRAVRKLDAAREGRRRSLLLDTLTRRMADVLRTLGDNKLYHRDLKVSNVLVSNCEDDPQPWLIDLDGVGTEGRGHQASDFGPRGRIPPGSPKPEARSLLSHGPRFRNMLARLVSSLSESTDLGATQHLRALKQLADRGGQTKGAWKAEWNQIRSAAARLDTKQRRGESDAET